MTRVQAIECIRHMRRHPLRCLFTHEELRMWQRRVLHAACLRATAWKVYYQR